ncbi:hypothetical protein [Pseudomonas fontis]|uniref:Lipoprotein n=1 Tax=Pseudomonas fontis TaxID=2942633 RepID=A0ABT5NV50_9PSED|nr:hypothetical protein [Pseudomonas fontis]MDD0974176.1 hypothetical protein [Pseudomonas fontis]MDD0992056.1 hypothetical protein [Pseudomonas fontis]
MRILIGAVAVALLAGCTTPSELKSGDAVFVSATKKLPKQYALCVFPKWQDLNAESAMTETETGYRLVMANPGVGQTDELLEVSKTSTGSTVRHFQRIALMQVGRGDVSESVKSCI